MRLLYFLYFSEMKMSELVNLVESILPITALCAITLFVTKEVIELKKRSGEKKRKLAAYKLLLAEELMKNAFTVRTIKGYFRAVLDESFSELIITKYESGFISVVCRRLDGGGGGGSLPLVYTAFFDKSIVDLAVLDSKFFSVANETYEALADVDNCRTQLMRFAAENDRVMLEGLSHYAIEKLDCAEERINKLYRFCSNKEMKMKVRSFLR